MCIRTWIVTLKLCILFADLVKIGGYDLFPGFLRDHAEEVRSGTCSLIATSVQNNPFCQERALELGIVPQLLKLLDQDEKESVKIKALYAVSCEYLKNSEFGYIGRLKFFVLICFMCFFFFFFFFF